MERAERLEAAGQRLAERFGISSKIAAQFIRSEGGNDPMVMFELSRILGNFASMVLTAIGVSEQPEFTENELHGAAVPYVEKQANDLRDNLMGKGHEG